MAVGTGTAILGGAVLGGMGSILGGKSATKGAKAAGQAELQASREAIAFQREALANQLGYLSPQYSAGTYALASLMNEIYGPGAAEAYQMESALTPGGVSREGTIPGVGSIPSSLLSHMGSFSGLGGAAKMGGLSLFLRNKALGAQGAAEPGLPGPPTGIRFNVPQSPTGGIFSAYEQSPLYNLQLREGERNINRSLAARGLFGSGAGIESLGRFYEGAGVQETLRRQGLLSALAGFGQTGAGMAGSALSGAAGGISSALMQGGHGQAQALMAAGQARGNMYNQLFQLPGQAFGAYKYISGMQNMNDMLGRLSGYGGTP